MTIYDDLQEVFKELAPEFSQGVIQYVAVTRPGGTAIKPAAPVEVPTTLNAFARGVSSKFILRGLAVEGDLQITFPGGIVTPNMEGYMNVDGKKHKIVSIIKKPSAGTPVAYTVIARYG